MNYRHQFHAGNFADVMKHALLVRLGRALQKKATGFLYLDTHAGRGGYDLAAAVPPRRAQGGEGDARGRVPEHPDGIGRLLGPGELPAAVADYVALVREFDRREGGAGDARRFYPGSPWLVAELARAQDRLALCEQQPAECAALRERFQFSPRTVVQELDGYGALRALLPPPERRALVLIDPPFEALDEFALIVAALAEGLRRLPGGVFAVWYPLTERARLEEFFFALRELRPPPTLAAELAIAGERSAIKLKGCGLVVINPPWQFDREAAALLTFLAPTLAQAPGGGGRVDWIVPEK
ncbi:MAG: 23S rRNA (adenine(2030)-N(6))-methyltransferase RlmJ [Opitutus sp.]|nr:23S rRNA (adenine(2030)-N(6))-methyltransferase RlmJ [Opitutus sp.]